MLSAYVRGVLLSGVAAVTAFGTAAHAEGTLSGTNIANTATVTFSVGGGGTQTATSTTANFVVDKKVNLTVAEVGGSATQSALGSTNQVTTFTVTNLTNAIQDFRLVADQQTVSIPILGTDNFDVLNIRAFLDVNGNGTYDPTIDTRAYIDELAPDATVTVFIVADIPATGSPNTAFVSLDAIAATGGTSGSLGADLDATSLLTPDSPTTVDIVFADGGGLLDLARNGEARAFDSYKISTAAVTIAKNARVVSDPINLLLNPRAIPGATLEYCLRVSNAGPANADNISLTDAIPANTTYVPGSIVVGPASVDPICTLLGTSEDDDAVNGDETDLFGGSFDGSSVKATIPSVTTILPIAVAFRVTLN